MAAIAVTQKFAENAMRIRIESQKLGTSTNYYQALSYSAHRAGLEMSTVSSALEGMQSKAAAALNGGALSVRDVPGTGCIFSITLPKPFGREGRRAHGAGDAGADQPWRDA